MSDNIKLIIEIPKDRYTDILRIADIQIVRRMPTLEQVVAQGIPLDDVKARIIDNAFKDANETGFIFIGRLWRIFDNIGKERNE